MKFHPILSKLVADFEVLSTKFHIIHTEVGGVLFLSFHPIMDDIYNFFQDKIDDLRERAGILGMTTPYTLAQYSQTSDFEELETCPSLNDALQMVIEDLQKIEGNLTEYQNQLTDDLVTQNMIIDINGAVGKFRWKLQKVLSK